MRAAFTAGVGAITILCAAVLTGPATADQSARERSGAELYTHWCADCHDPGPGHPGTLRMAGDLGPDQSVLRRSPLVNRQLIKTVVRQGFQMMPPFRPTEISDAELERLAAYLTGPSP